MYKPFFSIVVPIYNADKYLGELVESVLKQTCADWELILVDDGSTDGSWEICRKYTDSRITAYHTENSGMTAAVYYGISKSKGDYIISADADDRILPDCLEKVKHIVDREKCDIVIYGFRKFGLASGECRIPLKEGKYNREELIESITANTYYALWNKPIRGNIARNNCTCNLENILMNNDIAMIFPYLVHAKDGFVTEDILYEYRVDRKSVSHSITCSKIIDAGRTIGFAQSVLKDAGLFDSSVERSIYRTYIYQLICMFELVMNKQNILEDFEPIKKQKVYQEIEKFEKTCDLTQIKKECLSLFRKNRKAALKILLTVWGVLKRVKQILKQL